VGAILGAPFMLSTLAMFVTGIGVIYWSRRRSTGRQMPVDTKVLGLDIRYFFVAYALPSARRSSRPSSRSALRRRHCRDWHLCLVREVALRVGRDR
jgi:hypothetical protein